MQMETVKSAYFTFASSKYICSHPLINNLGLSLVVQKVDSDLYPVDNAIGFPITYPPGTDLYSG